MYGPDAQVPTSLRSHARWERLAGDIPVMLVDPDLDDPSPVVLWMHGRTVHKELDPGRYLRWLRSGIGACAVDLPGHGERFDDALQRPDRTFDVVKQMLEEIDEIVEALRRDGRYDLDRLGIGGVSAGGMATLARLCTEHGFGCASVEATSGSWCHQLNRPMFTGRGDEATALDPISHLDGWREIPLQALHAKYDEWVSIDGQQAFVDALRERYTHPDHVDFVTYGRTDAPYEHAGFGRMAADAKNRQVAFFERWLT